MKLLKKMKLLLSVFISISLTFTIIGCNESGKEALKDKLFFSGTDEITNSFVSVYSNHYITTTTRWDCYNDEYGNIYYFISGTDTLCGYSKKNYYGIHVENPITLEEAIAIANDYIDDVVQNFEDYSIILSKYAEVDAVYHIQYSYKIGDIPTHDLINVYVQENGEFGSYRWYNMGKFKNIKIDEEKLNSLPKDDNIYSEFITINSEGIILVRYIEVVNEHGHAMSVQKSYLIG